MRSTTYFYFTQVIRGKKNGLFPSFFKTIFWLMSWPYRLAVSLRNWAYDQGWLRQYQAPIPVVISVGNIVAGGSGKTPVTLLIAQSFIEERKLAILSRGYRSLAEKSSTTLILSSGKGPELSAVEAGDEPYLLAENLVKAWILVGKDRIQSANLASREGIEIVLLDDGMQHRQIARDYEVIVLDAEDPLGQNNYLPRGLLRENPKNLSRADLIFLNHIEGREDFEKAQAMIRPFTNAPVAGIRYRGWKAFDLKGIEWQLEGKKAGLFCGIAQPERFQATAEEMGVRVIDSSFFPDHHQYSVDKLLQLANRWKAAGADMMICTEKDKVKLPSTMECPLPLVWLKIVPCVVEGADAYARFIESVKHDLGPNS